MNIMVEKLATLWPEILLLIGACTCLVFGLAREPAYRRLSPWIAGTFLLAAGYLVLSAVRDGRVALDMTNYVKLAVVGVGFLLILVAAQTPSQLRQSREVDAGLEPFDPANVMTGEFFAFMLLSLTGVMLTAGASDLVWLFLSLELTSLPTYVMVATSRDRRFAQEAAVKYFFLGAMAVAVFLYGFALIYGATGFTTFEDIRDVVLTQGVSPLMVTGLVLALVGVSFKIAAVPMHAYAADVYQGAATPVTAFLAFVPKTAGFVAIILLLQLMPEWPTSGPVFWLIWIVAVLTMTVGNVLGLLQSSVKRVLAYSSIAHSGYMLVGLIAGPALYEGTDPIGDGVAAVLFYLVAYGLSTMGAFAVLGCLERAGDEADSYDDISGLAGRYPALAAIMLVCVLSLIGLPPLVGFLGKIYLFGSAITRSGGHPELLWLVIIAVLNSAVSAVYYLRIAGACYFGQPVGEVRQTASPGRRVGALVCAVAVIVIGIAGNRIVVASRTAAPTAHRSMVQAGSASEDAHATLPADALSRQ